MMNRTTRSTAVRVLLMLAVAVTSSGCAMKGDIRLLQDEIRAIAARQDSLVAELRMEAQQTQDTLRTQGDQMFDLRGDLNRQLREINQALQRIEAISGENQRGLAAVRDQLANGRRPSGTGAAPGGVPPTTGGEQVTPGGERLVEGGSAEELFGVARDQYTRGSLTSATRAFEDFLAQNPNHELAPRAHYFLADILVQQQQYEEALAAFQEIPELFPTAPNVPDALFRIAVLQIDELDDVDTGRQLLERIVNTYPDAIIAMLAREKLEEIG